MVGAAVLVGLPPGNRGDRNGLRPECRLLSADSFTRVKHFITKREGRLTAFSPFRRVTPSPLNL
jgi:hypothetical protein